MSKVRASIALLVAVALGLGCRKAPSAQELQGAVRQYLERLVEAYRKSDETLVDPLVGDAQGRKLLGLIGVKRDSGIFLDSQLLDLQFAGVRSADGLWCIETKERWHYRDRKLETGEQVGDESTDAYGLEYCFARKDGRWILENLKFVGEPQVGRQKLPDELAGPQLHGQITEQGAERPPGHPPIPASPGEPPAPPAGQASPVPKEKPGQPW